MKLISKFITVGLIIFALSQGLIAADLTAQEIISKHLESIGPEAKRKELKTMFIAGLSDFEAKLPIVKGVGKAVVVSDLENLYFLMSLNSHDYSFEKIGAFGKDISLPFYSPGRRSFLGSFLADNDHILSDSLFCGVMSMRWLTRSEDLARVKMKSAGTKKIDGHEAYAVDVSLSGSDSNKFRARMFFDKNDFRHIRSEYHRETSIKGIAVRQENQLSDASADLIEEFSEFKQVDGFTFPYRYKVTFSTNSPTGQYSASWGIRVAEYRLNQKLTPDFFTFDVK